MHFTSSAAGVAPVDMMQKFYFYAVSEISQIWQQNLELDGQFDHREVILAILHCNAHLNQSEDSFTSNAIDLIWHLTDV